MKKTNKSFIRCVGNLSLLLFSLSNQKGEVAQEPFKTTENKMLIVKNNLLQTPVSVEKINFINGQYIRYSE